MSITIEKDHGAEQIAPGVASRESHVGANVTTLAALKNGCAAGLGDGRVLTISADGVAERAQHSGAVTAIAATADDGVVSAGQDGLVLLTRADGGQMTLIDAKGEWITAAAHSVANGLTAAAYGKNIVVAGPDGLVGRFTDHPSSVADLCFSPAGDRLAVSRYDGVTIWSMTDAAAPIELSWKGSAVAVSWSPDGRYIAAATQDRELHAWDMVTGKDYRLGGFKAKPRQIAWSDDSAYLLSSGADVIASWPIAGGPGAFPPVEIGYVCDSSVSAVAGGPIKRLAGGFTNGAILIGDATKGDAMIARAGVAGDPDAEITRLAWDADHRRLYFGARNGALGLVLVTR
ncbi:MAG: hypothetical protein MRY74_16525 [Neomegalonema sp.]|nr:hypothetical protein [Neomegalonema sp.]